MLHQQQCPDNLQGLSSELCHQQPLLFFDDQPVYVSNNFESKKIFVLEQCKLLSLSKKSISTGIETVQALDAQAQLSLFLDRTVRKLHTFECGQAEGRP